MLFLNGANSKITDSRLVFFCLVENFRKDDTARTFWTTPIGIPNCPFYFSAANFASAALGVSIPNLLCGYILDEEYDKNDIEVFSSEALNRGTNVYCKKFDYVSAQPSRTGKGQDLPTWITRLLRLKLTEFTLEQYSSFFNVKKTTTGARHIETLVKYNLIKDTMFPTDNDEPLYEILDGKQRINALCEFYENRFPYKGKYFNDLSARDRNHFCNYGVDVAEIAQADKATILKYFLMLNTGGKQISEEHLAKVEKMYINEMNKNV